MRSFKTREAEKIKKMAPAHLQSLPAWNIACMAMETSEEKHPSETLEGIMTIEELINKLEQCNTGDKEKDHSDADDLLLEFIDSDDVKEAYDEIEKWYA